MIECRTSPSLVPNRAFSPTTSAIPDLRKPMKHSSNKDVISKPPDRHNSRQQPVNAKSVPLFLSIRSQWTFHLVASDRPPFFPLNLSLSSASHRESHYQYFHPIIRLEPRTATSVHSARRAEKSEYAYQSTALAGDCPTGFEPKKRGFDPTRNRATYRQGSRSVNNFLFVRK